MKLLTSFRTTLLAAALAVVGTSALAQTEELANRNFTNQTFLAGWASNGGLAAVDLNPGTAVNTAVQFNSGDDFLRQGLGSFASGTDLVFSFLLVDSFYTPSANAAQELVRSSADILQYGFQVNSGAGWSWVGGASGVIKGTNTDMTIYGATLTTTSATDTYRIAFDAFSSVNNERWSVIDNTSVTSFAAPVPEPETYAMLLAGLGAIGFMSRRRQGKTVASAA